MGSKRYYTSRMESTTAAGSRKKALYLALSAAALLVAAAMQAASPAWAGGEKAPGSALRVFGIKNAMNDGRLVTSGTVENIGSGEVRGISVSVVAFDERDEEMGKKEQKIYQGVWPGSSISFKVELATDEMPSAVRVFVDAPVERVIFDS
jgi:hypothetical protein